MLEKEKKFDASEFGFSEKSQLSSCLTSSFNKAKVQMEDHLNQFFKRKEKVQDLNDQVIVKLTQDFKEHIAHLEGKAISVQKIVRPPNGVRLRYTRCNYYQWPTKEWFETQT